MNPPCCARPTLGLSLGVCALSAAVLGVQILETRLFSVMMWHHLTYLVVTVTLLGWAGSGSLLAAVPGLARLAGDPRCAVSLCASAFGVTLLAAFALIARAPLDTLDLERDRLRYLWSFLHYAYAFVPFLFAGLGVAITMAAHPAHAQRVCAWNLVGSGLGCCLFVATIRALGGIGSLAFLVALSGCAGLAAAAGARGAGAKLARVVAALTASLGALGALAPGWLEEWIPVRPARSKALSVIEKLYDAQEEWYARDPSYPRRDPSLRKTLWGPLCRIDTLPIPRDPALVAKDAADPASAPRSQVHLFQDGDAPTVIWSRGHAREVDERETLFGLAYRLLERPEVLVLGPGGGNEVVTALHAGARRVTAVDVNGDTMALMRGPLAEFTGRLYEDPRVRAVHAEGRSFLRRALAPDGSPERFDLITLSGTDTYAALASGSYMFSESYLYTAGALDDMLAHLGPDGILQVLRFRFEPPRETLRLVVTAAEALQRVGVADPRRHFLVLHQEDRQTQALYDALRAGPQDDPRVSALVAQLAEFVRQPRRYGVVLARRRPFTSADVAAITAALPALDRNPAVRHELAYAADSSPECARTAYGRALAALAAGSADGFFAEYPYRVEPATDDRPFFFDFYRWADLVRSRSSDAGYAGLTGSEPIGRYVLAALALQTTLFTLALVLLPLLRLPRAPAAGRARMLCCFGCLGAAYLFVELATIQRFVLYLGHPTWSLSANLAVFLVFSGLGSAAAARLDAGRRGAVLAALAAVALLAVHVWFLPGWLAPTLALGEASRGLCACACVAPLAFCMGVPFSTALRLVGGREPAFVPWVLGVNGAAAVLASVLAIVVAMELGFRAVLLLGAGLYAVAAMTLPRRG